MAESIADGRYSTPLNLQTCTVLVTGGSSRIGQGLAERFLKAGATVIITGCREAQLKEAINKLRNEISDKSQFHYYVNDTGSVEQRVKLFEKIVKEHPKTNVLVNDAGIQRRVPLIEDNKTPWKEREEEIHINFSGPVQLSSLFIRHFIK